AGAGPAAQEVQHGHRVGTRQPLLLRHVVYPSARVAGGAGSDNRAPTRAATSRRSLRMAPIWSRSASASSSLKASSKRGPARPSSSTRAPAASATSAARRSRSRNRVVVIPQPLHPGRRGPPSIVPAAPGGGPGGIAAARADLVPSSPSPFG